MSRESPSDLAGATRRQMLRAGVAGAIGATVMSSSSQAASPQPAATTPVATPSAANPDHAPTTTELPLIGDWRFGGRLSDRHATSPDFDDDTFTTVTLPHTVTPLSWRDWEPDAWQDVWIYRRHFDLPEEFTDRRVFLRFEGVLTAATPWLNGHRLTRHLGGYLPFEYEITDRVRRQGNVLAVEVDARWLDVPPGGHPDGPVTVDYFQPGGIYRGVSLRAEPTVHLADVFAKPRHVLDPRRRRVEVECALDATAELPAGAVVELELRDGDRVLSSARAEVRGDTPGRPTATGTLTGLRRARLWDVTDPQLYHVVATLVANGTVLHQRRVRIGLREARFENDGFFLNGRRLKLFGINRHQLYPYTGMAMPDRVQRQDARILREDLNCTMVRCAHYPQSPAFLDACDELGLLVFEEIPGWQYLGDADWQRLVLRDVEQMIRRDRNRPSVVVWGVQINESEPRPELYRRTVALANAVDPTRQTTGAMLAAHYSTTDFFPDVFSYNDYTHTDEGPTLRPPLPDIPYLVTEAIGSLVGPHYYRRTDTQEVQARQAFLHAQAHDQAAADDRHAGLLAWQAFDYQSMNGFVDHQMKCNGVADAFRVPKLGAALYRAQCDPRRRPVIEPAFYWDFGPDSPTDGPGESAMICSNCERLEVYVGGEHRATVTPDRATFGHLPHPPSFVDLTLSEADREALPELRIDGYVAGVKVLTRRFSADPEHDVLSLVADDEELVADGSDATRVVFRVLDRHGAPRPFGGGEVRLTVDGEGELLGDNPFPFGAHGGVGAVWLRGRAGRPGTVRVTATHADLGSATVTVTTRPARRH